MNVNPINEWQLSVLDDLADDVGTLNSWCISELCYEHDAYVTISPSLNPSNIPTNNPTNIPSLQPTNNPTQTPIINNNNEGIACISQCSNPNGVISDEGSVQDTITLTTAQITKSMKK